MAKETGIVKKESKAVVIKKERKVAWGGVLPEVGANEKDTMQLQIFCNKVAQVYGVPSMGVNAMGGKPYLNKDGRFYLLNELRRGKNAVQQFKTEFIQTSTSINVPAIVKVSLIMKSGEIFEAIGEASKESVKLEAVKQTLNMMAETRAKNRAIWSAIGADVWRRVSDRIAKENGIDDNEKSIIMNAGAVSAEEMSRPEEPDPRQPKKTSKEDGIKMMKEAVDRFTNTADLIKYDEAIQASGGLPKEVKDEMHSYINNVVDKMTK